MGRKKFIDKKKSATFRLIARDSSDLNHSDGSNSDRIFVRVDANDYSNNLLSHNDDSVSFDSCYVQPSSSEYDPDSIFADVPEEEYSEDGQCKDKLNLQGPKPVLSDHIRKEILELGLPDDGYNYLIHLREVKNSGSGSYLYENSKATLHQVPRDEKAYDASRLKLHLPTEDVSSSDMIYNVASMTTNVKIQKVIDPQVSALLDDSDLSCLNSDVEELEEDFVIQANLPEDGTDELNGKVHSTDDLNEKTHSTDDLNEKTYSPPVYPEYEEAHDSYKKSTANSPQVCELKGHEQLGTEQPDGKQRVRRPLDDQFDMLTSREYGSDSDNDNDYYIEPEERKVANLTHSLKESKIDELNCEDTYRAPGDFLHDHHISSDIDQLDSPTLVIQKCAEYAALYAEESSDNDLVILEESSDESEMWDCETIISTYSNLDNHPGKIQAPEMHKTRFSKIVKDALNQGNTVIPLGGKEKLPVQFLPSCQRNFEGKGKKVDRSGDNIPVQKPHGELTKTQRKERKAAVKEEKREARRAKKEMKGLYKFEAVKAQRVAAKEVPCSVIHL